MCARYTIRELVLLKAALGFPSSPEFDEFTDHVNPRKLFNIAPSQLCPIVCADTGGQFVLSVAEWGLIPFWTKGKPKLRPVNAKSETLATNPMFRHAFERRRCLIPADGFYEPKGAKSVKNRPWYYLRFTD